MRVLGIESSCDETAAAVVEDGRKILSNAVASQVLTHEKYGGVVPELASREHLRKIVPVVDEACHMAGMSLGAVDALAVTEGPGLIGSLLVGLVFAKSLARVMNKPLVGVNHLEGHIHAVLLENQVQRIRGESVENPDFPNVTLVVSGGHTCLFRVEHKQELKSGSRRFNYRRLGQTRDDAAGEAFDKVSKLLALGYPGGPVIDKLARHGNAGAAPLGRVKMKGNPLDFSFSGLKTAVLYRIRATELAEEAERRRDWRKTQSSVTIDQLRAQCSQETLNLIAAFQEAVVQDLVNRTFEAARRQAVRSIFVSGGVACNSHLRKLFEEASGQENFKLFLPSPSLSTDNAAMIAAAGYFKLAAGERAGNELTAHASLPLGVGDGRSL
jgi:N6-L-threonylcarbamoyladenine synthase